MTIEQRIEDAYERLGRDVPWTTVESVIRAAFPDLYGDHPTSALVPVSQYMTEEQLIAALDSLVAGKPA